MTLLIIKQVDYERLATLGGFKNAASARACFAPVKKKIEASIASCPSTGSATSGSGGEYSHYDLNRKILTT